MKKEEGNILIVDDDKMVLRSLEILLKPQFELVKTLENPAKLRTSLTSENIDLVLLDMNFSPGEHTGKEGLFWLKEIMKENQHIIVLLFTAYGDIDLAVEGIKSGATDFILKPWNNDKLITTIKNALQLKFSKEKLERLQKTTELLSHELNQKTHEFIGESEKIKEIISISQKVAKTDTSILITGENGTGKEVLARFIHANSLRKNAPFVKVDLGALPETLFESELFGHAKGAFTDAKEDRTGRFQLASGGTLFLDEIGNIPQHLQAKLLSVLQNMEVIPVGSTRSEKIDVRVISATNKNLELSIEDGIFREDLFYRINTIQIKIPALRERKDDIELLVNYYLDYFATKYQKANLSISRTAKENMLNYSWPGNIRELKHCVEKAVILADTTEIKPEHFNFNTTKKPLKTTEWPLNFEEIEKKAILRAIENNEGKLTEAAKELGLTRQTLYNKLKKYKLDT